jgi:hypothetical protein
VADLYDHLAVPAIPPAWCELLGIEPAAVPDEAWPFEPGKGLAVRHKIVLDLWPLAVPVGELTPLPGNPRKGDVAAMRTSLATFGQRKPVVVNVEADTPIVEAGNTTLAAARKEGWTHLAIVRVRDDADSQTGYAVADNRLGQLGSFDLKLLADATSRLEAADPALLLASGYDHNAYRSLLLHAGRIDAPDPREEWVGMPEYEQETMMAPWKVVIAFPTMEDADRFFALIDRPRSRRMFWPDRGGFVGMDTHRAWVSEDNPTDGEQTFRGRPDQGGE